MTMTEEFYNLLGKHFSALPWTIYGSKSEMTNWEAFYGAVLAYALRLLPNITYTVKAEDTTSSGSIDLSIETSTRIFLIEHKVLVRDEADAKARQLQLEKKAKEALKQISEKDYAAKFSFHGKPITTVGVCFDAQTRSLGHVEVRSL